MVEEEEATWVMVDSWHRHSSLPALLRQTSLVAVRAMVQLVTRGTTSSSQSFALESRERIRLAESAWLVCGRRVRRSSLLAP